MMENNYFFKKLTSKHRAKRKMFCYYCKKQRIPIYITKTVLRTSNAIFNMKKVDLDES